MKINHSNSKRKMIPRIFLAAQTIAFVALAASSSIPSTSALTIISENRSIKVEPLSLQSRHGDHEDEEEEEENKKVIMNKILPLQQDQDHGEMEGMKMMEHEQEHSHTHSSNSMTSHSHDSHSHHHEGPHPYDKVPDPSVIGLAFIEVPPLPKGAGGHSHGHGGEAPKEEINETVILRGKGPEPLSYIEWDFNYGLGKPEELERFVNAYKEGGEDFKDLMGISGGRYRHLLDEKKNQNRKEIILNIQERIDQNKNDLGRHRFLLILHVLGCIISCFIMLPATLALRAASSSLAPLASLIYLMTLASSLFVSILYKAMTPKLYPDNSHSGLGYSIFWLSLITLGGDVFRLIYQIYSALRRKTSLNVFLNSLTLSKKSNNRHRPSSTPNITTGWEEYDPLEEERMLSEDGQSGISDAQELDLERMNRHQRRKSTQQSSGSSSPIRSVHFADSSSSPSSEDGQNLITPENGRNNKPRSWSRDLPSPSSTLLNTPRTSIVDILPVLSKSLNNLENKVENDKLIESQSIPVWRQNAHSQRHYHQEEENFFEKSKKSKKSIFKSILRYSHVTVARSIPVIAFAAAYTGLSVYTGSCRGPYKNVCLAHGIKGGIFFWYGLLSFGRYLGAYADLGWAWNKKPTKKNDKKSERNQISAEWVESFVIFIYGATNTWMERFGAEAGDPYTVKQVQHISIAVMFWFAGLMGMLLEVRSIKNLLAFPVSLTQASLSSSRSRRNLRNTEEVVSINQSPPSYSASFNPFPALVIGVTGIAMAAHHQDYVYEVAIHSLWGNLLAGFSGLRFLTYFLLWLRPPTNSIMPSRPPTEALASFSLACGGLVFMLSNEEVSFVAMRNGFGDFMMILNLTVAIIALLFCWIAGLLVLKAWALKREHKRMILIESEIELDQANTNSDQNINSTFIISAGEDEDEDDEEARSLEQDQKRQLSSSPEQV